MSAVVIMRGASGSGKSTIARSLRDRVEELVKVPWPVLEEVGNSYLSYIFSADDFFIGADGEYIFDRNRLSDAHEACLRAFIMETNHLYDCGAEYTMIVDNTNTSYEEILPYARIGKAFRCKVYIIDVASDLETCIGRNVHSVPPATIERQIANLARSSSRIRSLGEVVSSSDLSPIL